MDQPDQYQFVARPLALDEYRSLRVASGLSSRTADEAMAALENSWSFCHLRSATGEAVAMGRVIGDGGWYFVVADMAVLPTHQRRGLGARVLEWLLADIDERAPGTPYVTLTADPPGRRLYESFGFRDVAPDQTGMVLDRPGRVRVAR